MTETPSVTPFPTAVRNEDAPVYREMPHNTEAEQALLGAILVNNKAYEKVSDFLCSDHFYNPVHGRIYEAIGKLSDRMQVANPITLKNYFQHDGDLETIGGGQYLTDLTASFVTIINAADYGRTIYDHYLRRQLIMVGEDMVLDANKFEIDNSPTEQIEQTERKLYDLACEGDTRSGFVGFSNPLTRAITSIEAACKRESTIIGVTTGLHDLNKKLGGLHNSDLVILAGRPAMGKTALATNIAFNATEAYMENQGLEGGMIGFFSLEMSAEQLAIRILSERTRIESDRIRKAEISNKDFLKFTQESRKLMELPFFIDDTPALTISTLRTRARRLKREKGLHLIVVDYLQLLRSDRRGSVDNRVLELGEITRGLKTLAKELDVPVLALSQLSRALEQREDKRPQLSDLRESGSIEQDADVVMFVYREEYYHKREEEAARDKGGDSWTRWMEKAERCHNVAELIIGKQRHGPTGTIKLHFDSAFTRFSDLDTYHGG